MAYNFDEIKQFLKQKGLFGVQCFNTENHGDDKLDRIYCKDGVSIYLAKKGEDTHNSYYDIYGISEQDFIELEDAFIATINQNNIFGKIVVAVTLDGRAERLRALNQR